MSSKIRRNRLDEKASGGRGHSDDETSLEESTLAEGALEPASGQYPQKSRSRGTFSGSRNQSINHWAVTTSALKMLRSTRGNASDYVPDVKSAEEGGKYITKKPTKEKKSKKRNKGKKNKKKDSASRKEAIEKGEAGGSYEQDKFATVGKNRARKDKMGWYSGFFGRSSSKIIAKAEKAKVDEGGDESDSASAAAALLMAAAAEDDFDSSIRNGSEGALYDSDGGGDTRGPSSPGAMWM